LAQYLELTDMNQLWVADFTFVRLEEEFAYLAVVLDAYSRRVIGWSLGRAMNSGLVVGALKKALEERHPLPGLVHHSDQGVQYASMEYVEMLEGSGAVLSMSRAGRPWENGKCESFIKTLKHEEIDARPYSTIVELAAHVEEFIERIYNPLRLHSALAYLSPVEFEQRQERGKDPAAWLPATMSFPRHREVFRCSE
jgi:transposase InsO family protein